MLFTDIEGSTRLLQTLGDRYGDLLADHHRLLRRAFAAHGGQETGTAGDAFFVAFRRARSAVEASIDAQRALVRHQWPGGLECRVRMGLHTGEPSVGKEGYHGILLHRCARIADAAHGGQILLLSATAELVQDDLPAEASLIGLGEQTLKDLDRAERLYQLVVNGLRSEFPPVRTAAARPTSLVGFRLLGPIEGDRRSRLDDRAAWRQTEAHAGTASARGRARGLGRAAGRGALGRAAAARQLPRSFWGTCRDSGSFYLRACWRRGSPATCCASTRSSTCTVRAPPTLRRPTRHGRSVAVGRSPSRPEALALWRGRPLPTSPTSFVCLAS